MWRSRGSGTRSMATPARWTWLLTYNVYVLCVNVIYIRVSKVVSKVQERLSCSLQPGQVLAKYLLAPVNPADINVLQGDTTRDHESCLLRFVMVMMVTVYTR